MAALLAALLRRIVLGGEGDDRTGISRKDSLAECRTSLFGKDFLAGEKRRTTLPSRSERSRINEREQAAEPLIRYDRYSEPLIRRDRIDEEPVASPRNFSEETRRVLDLHARTRDSRHSEGSKEHGRNTKHSRDSL